MKLSKAQRELLADMPCACSDSYAPAKKLVALGLGRWIHMAYGGARLELTAQGIEARSDTTGTGVAEGESPVRDSECAQNTDGGQGA